MCGEMIHKFVVNIRTANPTKLRIPSCIKLLSAVNQHEDLVIYALVSNDIKDLGYKEYDIYSVMTGSTVELELSNKEFLNTVLFSNGVFVVHVFYEEVEN